MSSGVRSLASSPNGDGSTANCAYVCGICVVRHLCIKAKARYRAVSSSSSFSSVPSSVALPHVAAPHFEEIFGDRGIRRRRRVLERMLELLTVEMRWRIHPDARLRDTGRRSGLRVANLARERVVEDARLGGAWR